MGPPNLQNSNVIRLGIFRRPKEHINVSIMHSGSAQDKGDTRNTVL